MPSKSEPNPDAGGSTLLTGQNSPQNAEKSANPALSASGRAEDASAAADHAVPAGPTPAGAAPGAATGAAPRTRLLALAAPVTLVALVVVWQVVCSLGLVPAYLLPSPVAVVRALISDAPLLASHAGTTLAEAGIGLAVGVALGVASAVVMDRFEILYRAFYPLVVLTQTIPTVAIAPLLVLWFGYDMLPKIVLIVISTFFPITVGVLGGFRSVDPDEIDLMRSMGATELQILRHVKFPAALPQFFSGLKISAAYALVGAVIAEWLGGFSGLGVYMTRVRKAYSFDKMFAVILLISVLSLVLMWAVELVRRLATPWERAGSSESR